VSLEYGTILLDFGGKESVWVLGVELEGFTNVRPAHGAWWEWQFDMSKGQELEGAAEEKKE
jgi:hypothetical protein